MTRPSPAPGRAAPPVAGRSVDLVIFDNDGVLVDSELISARTLAGVLNAFGVAATPEQVYIDFMGCTLPLIRDMIEARTGGPLPPSFEPTYARDLAAAFEAELRPVPGVPELLDFLDALSIPYCVASNGTRQRIRNALRATGLLARFEGRIFSAEDVAHGKPAPDLFLHAADVLDVPPERCLVVEDTPAGITAARGAGMVVWAPASTYGAERLEGAQRISATMADLAAALRAELAASA